MFAGRFTAYPMWALVPVTFSPDGGKPDEQVAVLARASVTEPWKLTLAGSRTGDVPAPLPVGADATAGEADRAAGADLMTRVAAFLTAGTDPGLSGADALTQARTSYLAYDDTHRAALECRSAVIDQRPEDAVRVVRTSAGRLVGLTLRCELTVYAGANETISWKPDVATAYGTNPDSLPSISRFAVGSVFVHQTDDGAAQVVGTRFSAVRNDGVGWTS